MGFEVIAISVDENDSSRIDSFEVKQLVHDYLTDDQLNDGWGQLDLPDGSAISASFNSMVSEMPSVLVMFKLHGFTELQLNFILRYARAADMFLVDSGGGKTIYLTRQDQKERIAANIRSAFAREVYCSTATELLREMADGMKAFVELKSRLIPSETQTSDGPGEWVTRPLDFPRESNN